MTPIARTSWLAALMLVSAAAAADSARVSKDDVKQTIQGKTMVYVAQNGNPVRVYYGADGRLTGRGRETGKSSQSVGEWKVEDDGRICQTISQGPMTDRCYYLMRDDAQLSLSNKGDKAGLPVTLE